MSETLMVLDVSLDDQTIAKLRSLLISLVTVNPPHSERLPSHSLIRFRLEARMLSVSRQSQSRIVVLRLFQQGQVPGQCIGHSTSVKVVESH